MVKKIYDWVGGAALDDHTKKKHTILQEYFRKYLITRCKMPQREKFRLVVVDGFSGAGLYSCGSYGSPLVFVDVLEKTLKSINIDRKEQGMRSIQVECLLVLNDFDKFAIEQLRKNITPLLVGVEEDNSYLHIEIEYFNDKFDDVYPKIKRRLESTRCSNVLFNLDQCGHSKVNINIIKNIMQSWKSAEIFLTFPIESILAFISPDEEKNSVSLTPEIYKEVYALLETGAKKINKESWLGEVERIVFEKLKGCAPFVSPFSINNPDGWGYWLMHFANSHRARQVYNDILHANSLTQAHFGRSGLSMLSYDPKFEGQLYLFDESSRISAKGELYDDIPRLIAASGDALVMEEFYKAAYNETPAHSDDIHEMIIENPDVEVITESGGGQRRKPNTIKATDVLKLKSQRSWFSMFSENKKEQKD